jgi:hypothetical protein
LAPPASTDVLPVIPPPSPPRRTPRSPSLLPWIVGLVIGTVLLLILNALFGGADPAVQAQTPATQRSPSHASSSPSPRSPSATPSAPATGSVEEAAAALIGLVDELGSSGAVDDHLARDLQHGVDEIVGALDEGDGGKVLDELGKLQDKVDKGLEHGEISAEDAQRLDEAIQGLASAVDANSQDGDEGD